MSNPRSPREAFANLLRRQSARRAPAPVALGQQSVQERFATRIAAIAREKAADSAASSADAKPKKPGGARDRRKSG